MNNIYYIVLVLIILSYVFLGGSIIMWALMDSDLYKQYIAASFLAMAVGIGFWIYADIKTEEAQRQVQHYFCEYIVLNLYFDENGESGNNVEAIDRKTKYNVWLYGVQEDIQKNGDWSFFAQTIATDMQRIERGG